MPEGPLRLRAEDVEDLAVLAAAAQDAVFVVRDLAYEARERRFVVLLNRFRWETAGKRGPWQRVRSALAIESVLSVRSRKLRLDEADAAGSLLDMAFAPKEEPPGGVLSLRLAGGGEIALEVECIDVSLTDVSKPWPTPNRPDHEKP